MKRQRQKTATKVSDARLAGARGRVRPSAAPARRSLLAAARAAPAPRGPCRRQGGPATCREGTGWADRAPCLRLPASKSPAPRQFSGLYCSLTWGRRSPSLSEVPKSGASPLAWHNYPVPNFSFLFFLFIILLTAKTSEAWILCCSFAGLPIQNYLHVNKCTCQFGHHK